MKKYIVIVLAVTAIFLVGCKGGYTYITVDDSTRVLDGKEVIYDGPTEYIDEDYEQKALENSEFNWIWNSESKEFEKTPRHGTVFDE